MVIVELAGGLGNQMFQYAFGRAVALRTNSELVFDHRFIERRDIQGEFTYRNYALQVFETVGRRLDASEFGFADSLKESWSARLFRKVLPAYSSFVKEDPKQFRSQYLRLRPPVYISGYFQNPRYFNEFQNQIRKDFNFNTAWSAAAEIEKETIDALDCPVSLHVRRGDYLDRPDLQKICDQEYYSNCITRLRRSHPDLQVVVFSDDPAWVKENFKLDVPMSVVDSRKDGFKDYEDLRLMARCHHHIVANSSFSWWGAWLGENENKSVFAPSNWDGKRTSKNIVEDGWHLV